MDYYIEVPFGRGGDDEPNTAIRLGNDLLRVNGVTFLRISVASSTGLPRVFVNKVSPINSPALATPLTVTIQSDL